MSEEIDVSNLKTNAERCMLEGAVGYITYLLRELEKGKLLTVEKIHKKLSGDGELASGALASHFTDRLRVAGFASNFLGEEVEKA